MTLWEKRFAGLFRKIGTPFSAVLDADGCREGWLQGEAFRYFRAKNLAIYTNYLALRSTSGLKNRKADFAFYGGHEDDSPLQLVAEAKVYGEQDYQSKNLTGGGLAEVRRRLRSGGRPLTFSNCPWDRQLVEGSGLLADYFRLVDFVSPNPVERMLILCVRKAPKPDAFGNLLKHIEFERSGVVLHDGPGFWAKCWTVGAQS